MLHGVYTHHIQFYMLYTSWLKKKKKLFQRHQFPVGVVRDLTLEKIQTCPFSFPTTDIDSAELHCLCSTRRSLHNSLCLLFLIPSTRPTTVLSIYFFLFIDVKKYGLLMAFFSKKIPFKRIIWLIWDMEDCVSFKDLLEH